MKLNVPAAIGVAQEVPTSRDGTWVEESKRLRIDLKFKIKNMTSPDMFYFSYQYDEHHKVSFCTDTVYTCVGQDAPGRTSNMGGLSPWMAGTRSRLSSMATTSGSMSTRVLA